MNRGGGPRSWGRPPPSAPRQPGPPRAPGRYGPPVPPPPGYRPPGHRAPPPRHPDGRYVPPFGVPPGAAPYRTPLPAPRRPRWGRRLVTLLLVLVLALLGYGGYLDTKLSRDNALASYAGRPTSEGTNWLIVGSDSRADLTEQQEERLATGHSSGQRTDTIMLLHTGSNGTTLVSLPRDSLLPIPEHNANKLNSAFSAGGAQLLTRTVEQATGLRIDHYAEIGFEGFVQVVDAVGGVDMCIPSAMRDPLAGLNIKAGCQELDGPTALGYVRSRATPRADLDRIEHQRLFLSALMKRLVSPFTLANPVRLVALGEAVPGALKIDSGDHVWHLAGLGLAMRGLSAGDGATTTVPIGSLGTVNGSSIVRWDKARAKQLFAALAADRPVPKSLLN